MPEVNLDELRGQLMARIDDTDLLEVKKIENLIKLYELDAKCDAAIADDGAKIVIKNGSQEFIKSHPSMNDKMKINAQIIALEKSIKFKLKNAPSAASPSSVEGKPKRGDLI